MTNVFKRFLKAVSGGKKEKAKKNKDSGQFNYDCDGNNFDKELERRRTIQFTSPNYDYPPDVPSHKNRLNYDEEEDDSQDPRYQLNKSLDANTYKRRKARFRSYRAPRQGSAASAAYTDYSDHDEYFRIEAPPSKRETIRRLQAELEMARGTIRHQAYMLNDEQAKRMLAEREAKRLQTTRLHKAASIHQIEHTGVQRYAFQHYRLPDSPESLQTVASGAADVRARTIDENSSDV